MTSGKWFGVVVISAILVGMVSCDMFSSGPCDDGTYPVTQLDGSEECQYGER